MEYPEDQRSESESTSEPAEASSPASDEKNLAVLCHLLGLLPFFYVIGPVIVWQWKKDDSAFITRHALACINFQISLLIYLAVFGVLSLALIGIPFLIATGIFGFVMPIIGAIKAGNGEEYPYPLAITFVR